jgi:putative tryptophan/tyrosine transport system substrate-binding protein
MRRREFITLIGGAATGWPLAARAQVSTRRPLIGYLAGASSTSALSSTGRSFLRGLRDQGYVEGRDLDITYRFADGYLERLPGLAEELVRLKPDVILAPATAPALVAKRVTATIPIVCPLLENPVGLGLAASHNRPGGNVTGILRYVDGLAGKNLQLVTQLLPGAVRVGVLVNVNNSESIDNRRDTEAAARKFRSSSRRSRCEARMTSIRRSGRWRASACRRSSCCRIPCFSASTDALWRSLPRRACRPFGAPACSPRTAG